jgi:molybdopterin/thiamine biosynthesis adenylyltransferase
MKGVSTMNNQYDEITSRNIGIFTREEQNKLRNSTIAIAGVGGVGGLLAERLIRIGVGNIRLTDNGTFEKSNFNRQFGADMSSINKNKAEVVYRELKSINPEAVIDFSDSGIKTEDDAKSFVNGCDLVIDEMDYGAWKSSIFLQRAARDNGIYYIFSGAIGFGALLSNFSPEGITLEEYNKLPADIDLGKVDEVSVSSERILPVIPSYINHAMDLGMIQEIIRGQRPVPTCSIGVGLASIAAAGEAINILLQRGNIVKAPRYIYIDLLDKKFVSGEIG